MNEYYCDNLIRRWVRDRFEANSDEEAIKLAEDGTYNILDQEQLYDCDEYVKTNDASNYVFELCKSDGTVIKSTIDD